MIQKPLDEILKSWCSRNTPSTQHFYTTALSHAHHWITKLWGQEGGGIQAIVPVKITGRVIDIPEGFTLSQVGIDVNGSFSPLGVNLQMVSVDDGCFDTGGRLTGHPDNPTHNDASQFWPGQGAGQSANGYYRHFDQKNIVLLDSAVAAKHKEILLKGNFQQFVPYRATHLDERCIPPLEAYLKKMMIGGNPGEYTMRMETMRAAMTAQPGHVYASAWKSGLGKT